MALSHGSALTERVIGLAIDVHRHLGPGLLESAYEECLCFDLRENAIPYGDKYRCPSTRRSDWNVVIGWILSLPTKSSSK